jgi:hypothetical protein
VSCAASAPPAALIAAPMVMAIASFLIISLPPLLGLNCSHGHDHGTFDRMPEAAAVDR